MFPRAFKLLSLALILLGVLFIGSGVVEVKFNPNGSRGVGFCLIGAGLIIMGSLLLAKMRRFERASTVQEKEEILAQLGSF